MKPNRDASISHVAPKPLVVIAHPSGRLANRLWLFANLIANSHKYGYRVANIAFYDYAKYFENLKDDLFCRYPLGYRTIPIALGRWLLFCLVWGSLRVLSIVGVHSSLLHSHIDIRRYRGAKEAFDLGGREWQSMLGKRMVVVEGLEFRDWESLVTYRRMILDFLTPRSAHLAAARIVTKRARADSECILCGIHMRLGDYKQFKSGSWFYTIEQYIGKMKEFCELFKGAIPIRFLVCSDEILSPDAFRGLPVSFGSGQFMEDWLALAQCDFILGPPSTFSAWASFYGDVPLKFLFDLSPLTRESFIPTPERIRRRVRLSAEYGANLPHTGFLELFQDGPHL